MNRPSVPRFLLFAYVWLMVGFATGTVVLLGPTRWVTEAFDAPGAERAAMLVVILSFIGGSFLLALYFTRVLILRHPSRPVRGLVVVAVTGSAMLALWGWRNPVVYSAVAGVEGGGERMVTESGSQFLFGPYPDRERLQQLKEEGVTAVVSLQHPAVVPFEPEGIAREKEWTKELGIRFVHAPMLPWVSDNERSLETIRELVRSADGGTYYVHCGLGRDRVSVVQRVIERMGGRVASDGATEDALTWADREAEGLGDLERGPPIELEEGVWVVPYPNKHEMFGHMLGGQVEHVLLLLDDADPVQAEWLASARELLTQFDVPHTVRSLDGGDGAAASEIARTARRLPRPLTVIVPFTGTGRESAIAGTFRSAWVGERGRAAQAAEAAS
ncbi:MAG: hypothetical protein KY466_00090 [Gemmatimonadetes bacterium]|nr:hypothetical protein [Gemmatimonadota bacterium]